MRTVCIAVFVILLNGGAALAAPPLRLTFAGKPPGAEASSLVPLIGNWHLDKDGGRGVYAVDGRKWEQGMMAPGAAGKAKLLFGDKHAEFLGNIERYRYFPLSVCRAVKGFKNGSIEVSFKPVSGRIDQAAGIAFDIKPDGHYLVLRANPLENNLVLFDMEGGRRTTVQWVKNVTTASNQWHTLTLRVNGKRIEGYLDNKKYVDCSWNGEIDGKIGLWSKADSYVFFDNLVVKGL